MYSHAATTLADLQLAQLLDLEHAVAASDNSDVDVGSDFDADSGLEGTEGAQSLAEAPVSPF